MCGDRARNTIADHTREGKIRSSPLSPGDMEYRAVENGPINAFTLDGGGSWVLSGSPVPC